MALGVCVSVRDKNGVKHKAQCEAKNLNQFKSMDDAFTL